MTKEQYSQKVKDIMINKNPYGAYHQQNFNTYSAYGEMTPINSDIINNMPNSKIILSEEVYGSLLGIQDVTNIEKTEIPFLLYGKEVENNLIEFDSFITSSTRENRQSTEANYDEKMEKDLMNKLNNNQYNGFVVCHGHSHPRGSFSENFSLGDFTSYIQMNQENQVFKTKQAELIACLVTSTGDINFVFYDNTSDNFYRFTDVFVKDKDNNLTPVSCYGLNQRESANITNRILS